MSRLISRRVLSRRASFWTAAGVVAHTLWTSAAPAMTYPLYARQWNLTPTLTTAIFAIYPVTVVGALLVFGDLSDRIGRGRAMFYGVAASASGVLLFALATDVDILFAGRVLMGIGVGLSAGPSAAALVDFAGEGAEARASSVAIVAQATGFSAALLVGGALTQYAPFPTRLSFAVLLALLLLLLAALSRLPGREGVATGGPWRLRLPQIPPEMRLPFWFTAVTVMTAYTHGVLVTSLGAEIAEQLVRSSNVFINGAALSIFAVALGVTGLVGRRLAARLAILLGSAASLVGMLFLAIAVLAHSLAAFVAASAVSGIGYAFMVYGGLAIVSAHTPKAIRGSIMSAVFLLAYLFTGALALGLGKTATISGLPVAALTGITIMATLCLVVVAGASMLPLGAADGSGERPSSEA
ncbi:MFS family permease [Inquilinus ginsengisoli]|uniref:MFS transporter n=1 Tax=Inquilinus ginsengisoli TaxID=363840 RepID=UPI003D254312